MTHVLVERRPVYLNTYAENLEVYKSNVFLADGISGIFYVEHEYFPATSIVYCNGLSLLHGEDFEEAGPRSLKLHFVPKRDDRVEVRYKGS